MPMHVVEFLLTAQQTNTQTTPLTECVLQSSLTMCAHAEPPTLLTLAKSTILAQPGSDDADLITFKGCAWRPCMRP